MKYTLTQMPSIPVWSFDLNKNNKYLCLSGLSSIFSIWDLVLESPNETIFFLGDGAFPFSVTFCIFSGALSSLFLFPRAPRKQFNVRNGLNKMEKQNALIKKMSKLYLVITFCVFIGLFLILTTVFGILPHIFRH